MFIIKEKKAGKHLRLLLSWSFLLCHFSSLAQSTEDHSFILDLVTDKERASFGSVVQLHQDTTGRIWMGMSGKGISVYDGRYIEKVFVPGQEIFSTSKEVFLPFEDHLLLNMGQSVHRYNPYQQKVVDTIRLPETLRGEGEIFSLTKQQLSQQARVICFFIKEQNEPEYYLIIAEPRGDFHQVKLPIPPDDFHFLKADKERIIYKSVNGIVELNNDGELVFEHIWPAAIDNKNMLSSTTLMDERDNLWLSFSLSSSKHKSQHQYGLYKYHLPSKSLSMIEDIPPLVQRLMPYKNGFLIIGLFGLNYLDWETNTIQPYKLIKAYREEGFGTRVSIATSDLRSGVLWIGCENGLAKLVPDEMGVKRYPLNAPREIVSVDDKLYAVGVQIVKRTASNDISMGAFQPTHYNEDIFKNGLLAIDPKTDSSQFHQFPVKVDAFSITQKDNHFFAGGLKFKLSSDNYEEILGKRYAFDESNKRLKVTSLPVIQTWDRDSMLWMIRWRSSTIHIVDPLSLNIKKKIEIRGLSSNSSDINILYKSPSDHSIWMGTNGDGLFHFHPDGYLIDHYTTAPTSSISLPSNVIAAIYEDADQNIWFGTDLGLIKMNLKSKAFERYALSPDQPYYNMVYGILPEGERYLWVATNKGLYRFDKENNRTTSFPLHRILNELEFNRTSFYKSEDGYYHFGGINKSHTDGIYRFRPEDIVRIYEASNKQRFKILINKLVRYDASGELERITGPATEHIQKIILNPGDRYFELEFTSSDMRSENHNQYTYRLEGYEENWKPLEEKNYLVRYENLPPGNYKLHLRGGIIPEQVELTSRTIPVLVIASWYQRWWALTLFSIMTVGGIFLGYRTFLRRRLDKEETRRLKEFDQVKTRMYTNITHELRTPLTVILGLTDQIENQNRVSKGIRGQSKKLLTLINQILNLSKVESGMLKAHYVKGDIVLFIEYLVESFTPLAHQKNMQLTTYAEQNPIVVDYDPEKIEYILTNLIHNAIKYTPKGGKVIVHLCLSKLEEGERLLIKVTDTGRGIEAEHLPHLFDRFYQVDSDGHSDQSSSTGIGLALTKELVELLEGSITVQSTIGQGTQFEISLPVSREMEEVAVLPNSVGWEEEISSTMMADSTATTDQEAPTVLVVEDNPEILAYIRYLLQETYLVHAASDGAEGIQLATELIPDIILTDIMMPKVDGITLTRRLKQNPLTSHIPIIIITAKATQDDKNIGLKVGADAYLYKPFNREELQIRMRILVQKRRYFNERYQNLEAPVDNSSTVVAEENVLEDEFVTNLRNYVLSRISDSDLNVADLSAEVNMSQSQLYRKLKALTTYSPVQFVRQIRLQEAFQQIENSDKTISEIAYDTGFTDPNYFSRAFKQVYNKTPKSLREAE